MIWRSRRVRIFVTITLKQPSYSLIARLAKIYVPWPFIRPVRVAWVYANAAYITVFMIPASLNLNKVFGVTKILLKCAFILVKKHVKVFEGFNGFKSILRLENLVDEVTFPKQDKISSANLRHVI